MSTDTQEQVEMGTKPKAEHAWLQKLVGEWRTEAEMMMGPDQTMKSSGTESVKSLGGLWAAGEGKATMGDGSTMEYRSAVGYDVSFNEYRGCWFASMSSHLWKYTGKLSADGKTMTMDCVGPNMMGEGTANYRDIIEIIDDNHRTLTSFGEDENGNYNQFMKVQYTRV